MNIKNSHQNKTGINMYEDIGFDRHNYVKRAKAFDHVIFASCARRIILQKGFGYGHLVAGTLNPTLHIFRVFLKKVIVANDAKAYYISMCAFYKFLMLIDYPIPPEELNLMLMDTFIYSQDNVSVSVKQIKGDK